MTFRRVSWNMRRSMTPWSMTVSISVTECSNIILWTFSMFRGRHSWVLISKKNKMKKKKKRKKERTNLVNCDQPILGSLEWRSVSELRVWKLCIPVVFEFSNFVKCTSMETFEKMELDINTLCNALNILVKPADKGVYKEVSNRPSSPYALICIACRKTMVWSAFP